MADGSVVACLDVLQITHAAISMVELYSHHAPYIIVAGHVITPWFCPSNLQSLSFLSSS